MTDRRFIRDMPEWGDFMRSDHQRDVHCLTGTVAGCMWCERSQELDDMFVVASQEIEARVQGTLWDGQ